MGDELSLPYVDPTGQSWDRDEIQAVVNQTGSFGAAVDRLGLKTTNQLRHLGILTPTEWVKSKALSDNLWLPRLVVQHGSLKKLSEFLNVSVAHLSQVLNTTGFETKLPEPNPEQAKQAMKKFGSVILASRILNTTPNQFKKALPDWKSYRDPTKAGNHSIRTGRIAEQYFEKCRSGKIVISPALENHNFPGYDHMDSEYGRVNTKAAVVENHKWVWELKTDLACDCFALVQLDMGRNPVGMQVVTKKAVIEGDLPKGFTLTIRSTGDVAIQTKSLCCVRDLES